MMRFSAVVLALLAGPALALPGEDHWSADADSAAAESYAEAQSLIEAEAYAKALPILQQLAKDTPGSADIFNLLGYAYRKTGDLMRSGPAYERALFLDPDHLGALEYQGELFLLQGNPAGAEANLARLNRLCPSPCEERDELAEAIDAWKAGQN